MCSMRRNYKRSERRKGEIIWKSSSDSITKSLHNFRSDADTFDYVKEEIGFRLSDRLFDIKKEFENGVDLGGGRGYLTRHILAETVKNLKVYDVSPTMLDQVSGTPGVNIEKHLMTQEIIDASFIITNNKQFVNNKNIFLVATWKQSGSRDIQSRPSLVQWSARNFQIHQQFP